LEENKTISFIHQASDASRSTETNSLFSLLIGRKQAWGCVYDKKERRFISLKSFRCDGIPEKEELEEMFGLDAHPKVHIFLPGLKTALVPAALFEEDHAEEFFKLNHSLQSGECIRAYPLTQMDAVLLYAASEDTMGKIVRQYPASSVFHHSAPWLETLCLQAKSADGIHVHVEILEEGIQLAAFDESKLLIHNTFLCSSAEDRLYYTLFVSEQLRISPQRDRFYLSGLFRKGDDTHQLFRSYIKELLTESRPSYYNYSLPLTELPEHLYFKAFCTAICES
jgi:hypothetical protein